MKQLVFVTILLLCVPRASTGQTTLFGGVGRGAQEHRGEVVLIDPTTATGTLLGGGAADESAGLNGLAFDSSGQLFASTIDAPIFPGTPPTPQSTLIRLDPLSGEQLEVIGIVHLAGESTPLVINDLAIQPGTDVLFATALNATGSSNNIYTIDKTNAEATFVGSTGVIGATLAFGPDGTLYQTSAEFEDGAFVRGFLNTLDPLTAAVLTTSAPFTAAHIGALAVRPTDGVIFGSAGRPDNLYILSPAGELTLVGEVGFNVGDLAFTPLPSDKDACKKGGWRTNFPFSFKNQGDCIQYVNTGK